MTTPSRANRRVPLSSLPGRVARPDRTSRVRSRAGRRGVGRLRPARGSGGLDPYLPPLDEEVQHEPEEEEEVDEGLP